MKALFTILAALLVFASANFAYASGEITQSTSVMKDGAGASPNVGLGIDEAVPYLSGFHLVAWTGVGYYSTVPAGMNSYYYQIKGDLVYDASFLKGLSIGVGGGWASNDLRVDPANSAHLSLAYKLW